MKKITVPKLDTSKALDSLNDLSEAVRKTEVRTGMTKLEKEEFTNRVKGMSTEELELLVELIPVDMCLARVNKEIDRLRSFENTVRSAVGN